MTSSPATRMLLLAATATSLVLLVPLVAMRFTSEVRWGPGDFLAGSILLFAAFSALALAPRLFPNKLRRLLFVGAVLIALALVWAELAVGLFH